MPSTMLATSSQRSVAVFHVVEDVAPLDHVDGVVAVLEELRQARAVNGVGFVLEAVDLDADVEQILAAPSERREEPHRAMNVLAGLEEHASQVHRGRAYDPDLEEHEPLADRVDEVQDIVELRDQAVDIEPIEG